MSADLDTESLPPTMYLALEVLVARWRLGETAWTFPTSVGGALARLQAMALVGYKNGVGNPKTYLAWLTPLGRDLAMKQDYEPPILDQIRAVLPYLGGHGKIVKDVLERK